MKVEEYWHETIKNYRYDGRIKSAVGGGEIFIPLLH